MKTQSKSIKTLLTTLLLSMTISSIEAQQWTLDEKGIHEVKEKKENIKDVKKKKKRPGILLAGLNLYLFIVVPPTSL